jgi:WD40 repeat protein
MNDHIQGDKIGGDKVIGNKIIYQQAPKELTNTPYKFLTAYAREDKAIFYGRTTVTEEFAGKVPRFKTLMITGASGSGKSSLVNAGIIPRLEENGYFCLVFSEYAKPLEEFQQALVQQKLLTSEQLSSSLFTLLQQLLDNKSHFVIVFDQFERFFVNVPTSLRHQFIVNLAECITSHFNSEQVNFLFVLRQDFLGQMLAEFEVLLPNFIIDSARLNLLPLSLDEAQQAIIEPLEHLENQRVFYDEDFVKDVLLVDLQAQSEEGGIYPAHLQVVCNQLYEMANAQQGKRVIITEDLYQPLGGVQAILQHYLDNAIAQIARDSEQVAIVRSILKTMIESSGTRKFVSLTDLQRALSDVAVQEVEAFLEQLRLLRVIEIRAPQYSLSHEFMVEKVRSWFDEREMARQQALETLQRGMAEWQASGALLNEKQVGMIRQWSDDLLEDEQQLLRDSEQVYEARQRREALQKKAAVTAVIAILILAVVSVFFAISSENAKRDAQEKEQEAKKQTRIALSENLVSKSMLATQIPNEMNGYYEHALLLAVQAFIEKNNVTSRSNLLRVLQSHQCKKNLYGHSDHIAKIAFSTDGKTLVSGSLDDTIKLWDIETGKALGKPLIGHSGSIRNDLAFSPNNSIAASITKNHGIQLWDIKNKKFIDSGSHLKFVGSRSQDIAFSPDGKILASADIHHEVIRLWDVKNKHILSTFLGHSNGVVRVAFKPDGKELASADASAEIRLWDIETGYSMFLRKPNSELSLDAPIIYAITFSPDGKTLAAGGNYGEISLWNIESEQPIKDKPLIESQSIVSDIAFSPNGKILASGGYHDGLVKLWDIKTKEIIGKPLVGHTKGFLEGVFDVEFSPDGKVLASGGFDNIIRLWNINQLGEPFLNKSLTGYSTNIFSVEFSPDGKTLVSGGEDATIRLWDVKTGQALGEPLTTHQASVFSVGFSPDGKTLISGSDDNIIRFWDVETRKLITTQTGRFSFTSRITLSPNGKILAVEGKNHIIKLLDFKLKKFIGEPLVGHSSYIRSMAFSPNGKILASGSMDKTIRLWDVETRKPIGNPLINGYSEYTDSVENVVFSPDGKILVSGSNNKTIKLWDIKTRKLIGELVGHSSGVKSLAFSPNGEILASGSWDGTIRLWDVETLQAIGTALRCDLSIFPSACNEIEEITFSPNGNYLVSSNSEGIIMLWDVDPESWAKKACAIVNRNFSHKEWQKYMGNRPHEKTCTDLPKDTLGAIELAAQAREHLKNGETQQAKTKFKQAREWDNNVVWGDEEL